MSFNNDVNGTKIIRRFNPALMVSCFLGLAIVGVLLLYCFLPVITLTYVEGGVETTVSVNAYNFFEAFINRINSGTHTELGDSFLTFIRDQRGTTLNQIQSFLINGCDGRMEQVTMVTFAGLIAVIGCFAIVLAIVSFLGLCFGRLHLPGTISVLSALVYTFLSLLVAAFLAFAWIYGDIVSAIVNNAENTVSDGSLSPVYMPIIYLVIIIALQITISILNRKCLKGRVFVKR